MAGDAVTGHAEMEEGGREGLRKELRGLVEICCFGAPYRTDR